MDTHNKLKKEQWLAKVHTNKQVFIEILHYWQKFNYITPDAINIEPKAVVKHYCFWFDFYGIRRYNNLVFHMDFSYIYK